MVPSNDPLENEINCDIIKMDWNSPGRWKLKVALLSTGGSGLGDSIRTRKVAETLAGAGHRVDNVRIPSVSRQHPLASEGLRSLAFPLHTDRALSRLLDSSRLRASFAEYASLNIAEDFIRRILPSVKPDVVVAETSLTGFIATRVAKELSVPCIVDFHGLGFAEARGQGQQSWQKLLELEKKTMEQCYGIVVVSSAFKDFIVSHLAIPSDKIVVAPNGCDSDYLVSHYQTPMNVIYAGVYAYWENVEKYLEIADRERSGDFRFFMAGAGPLERDLLSRIRHEGIPIKNLGYLPREKLMSLLSRMQIGIAPSSNDLARQVASPIKVMDYISCGLPVIVPRIGDWGRLVLEESCGVAVEDQDVDQYIAALRSLLRKDVWSTTANNAIRVARGEHTWTNSLHPMLSLIGRI